MGPFLAYLTVVHCLGEIRTYIYTHYNLLHYQSLIFYCMVMKQWTFSHALFTILCVSICLAISEDTDSYQHPHSHDEIQYYSRLHSYQYHPPQIEYLLPHSCQCPSYHAHHLAKEQSNVYYLYSAAYIPTYMH
eukprot:502232_1